MASQGQLTVFEPTPCTSRFKCMFRDGACTIGAAFGGGDPGPWFPPGSLRGSYFNARRRQYDGICLMHWQQTVLSLQESLLPEGSCSGGPADPTSVGLGVDAGSSGEPAYAGDPACADLSGKGACASGPMGRSAKRSRGGPAAVEAAPDASGSDGIRRVRRRGYAGVTAGGVCAEKATLRGCFPHLEVPTATDEDLSRFLTMRKQRHASWGTREVDDIVTRVLGRHSIRIPFPLDDGGLSSAEDPVEFSQHNSLPYIPLGRPENRARRHKEAGGWT